MWNLEIPVGFNEKSVGKWGAQEVIGSNKWCRGRHDKGSRSRMIE